MALTRTKPQADASADFNTAQARWRQLDAEWQGRLQTIRAIQVALSLAISPTEAESDRCTWARGIAADYLPMANRQPKKLKQQLEELEDQVDLQQAAYLVEVERWQQAQRDRSREIALELQPRQREAVKQIDAALRARSEAIAAERAVHADFAARAPLSYSPFLPDLSGELAAFGDRGHNASTASKWDAKIRKLKLGIDR